MSSTIAASARAVDPSTQTPPATAAPEDRQAPRDSLSQATDLRLVIEEDETTGRFIYKTLDRRTGEVIRQLPREEVLRLKEEPGYSPGGVVDSRT